MRAPWITRGIGLAGGLDVVHPERGWHDSVVAPCEEVRGANQNPLPASEHTVASFCNLAVQPLSQIGVLTRRRRWRWRSAAGIMSAAAISAAATVVPRESCLR